MLLENIMTVQFFQQPTITITHQRTPPEPKITPFTKIVREQQHDECIGKSFAVQDELRRATASSNGRGR